MNAVVPCYYHLDVEVSPEKVGQVRRILAAHLRYWNLEILAESVCQCAEALLHTIDRHATDKNTSIEMWWNGQHLITAISDNNQDIRPHYAPQGCLARIAALSDGWGCCATGVGGKIIWFARRVQSSERAPLVPAVPSPALLEALQAPREVPVPALAGPAADAPVEAETERARARTPDETAPRPTTRPRVPV
ncbi:pep a2 [Streptomyces sp. NPDC005551]|uniref:pep a2 n=1 Tax=unclassified Streptomyces TaxID=2593676 RepID=UPI003407586D